METAKAFMNGPGILPQLILVVVTLGAIYLIFNIYEKVVKTINKFLNQTVTLVPDTITAGQIIPQYPKSGFPLLYQSENEIHGLEQSFSMWIFVHPDTFDNKDTFTDCGGKIKAAKRPRLKHIFHKGNKDAFPLLAPGIFCESNKNTLRIYANSVDKWDNVCEIPNIPVGKWFHLVVSQKGKFMDVFVNGNVEARHQFNTVPKINYGGLYIMQNIRTPRDRTTKIPSSRGEFSVDGPIKGMMSRVKYFAHALTYSHIDSLYRETPSKVVKTSRALEESKSYSGNSPPYFYDNWWVTRY